MPIKFGKFPVSLHTAAAERLRAFVGDDKGASIVIIELTMPALLGAMGLAAEVS